MLHTQRLHNIITKPQSGLDYNPEGIIILYEGVYFYIRKNKDSYNGRNHGRIKE